MSRVVSDRQIRLFRERVWAFYHEGGRRDFPWRHTSNPYEILVSEFMLQQTQTSRILQRFSAFLSTFPTIEALSVASRVEVLQAWQGLGYNRRALFLHRSCQEIVQHHAGRVPSSEEVLRGLPGIGLYTAAAIRVFAFNAPAVLIETNIRAAVINDFFPDREQVLDAEIRPLLERAGDLHQPRDWYYALMDYGAFLKRQHRGITARSAHYVKQSKFQGSVRQMRGAIIRALLGGRGLAPHAVERAVADELGPVDAERFGRALDSLLTEGLISSQGGAMRLAV